ncbi:hypothetical protein KQ945_08190 [Bacillus subtilis subsp. subtilis]|nr:hypothetical protein [Bacillus subtilis subsp. subtilis]
MTRTASHATLATLLLAFSGSGAAATVSLSALSEQAARIDVQLATAEDGDVSRMQTRYFANGDQLATWDDGGVLMLCRKAGYLKVPAAKPEVARLPLEQRQMLVYAGMMASIGGVVSIMQSAGADVDVADDGSVSTRTAESHWAYGIERSEITTQRMPDGALRVRTRKTETLTTTPPSSPEDVVSTDADRAARLAELPAVGSWTEVVFSTAAKEARIDPAFPLKGWVSAAESRHDTVGQARAAAGCED